MRWTLLGAFAAVGAGCGSGAGLPRNMPCAPETPPAIPVGGAPAMNNAATVQGAPFGLGYFEGSCEVRRRVPVVVAGAATDLTVGDQASLLRASPLLSITATAIVPVRNDGATILCSGLSIDVRLIGAGGAFISSEQTDLVGSVANFPVGGSKDCLGPGESGFVQGGAIDTALARPLWDEVTRVEVFVNELYDASTRPGGALVPRSYTVTPDIVTVTYENVGTAAARTGGVANTGELLLLDSDGLPVDWGFFDTDAPEVTIPPGGTGTVTSVDLPHFTGRVSSLRAFLVFD